MSATPQINKERLIEYMLGIHNANLLLQDLIKSINNGKNIKTMNEEIFLSHYPKEIKHIPMDNGIRLIEDIFLKNETVSKDGSENIHDKIDKLYDDQTNTYGEQGAREDNYTYRIIKILNYYKYNITKTETGEWVFNGIDSNASLLSP